MTLQPQWTQSCEMVMMMMSMKIVIIMLVMILMLMVNAELCDRIGQRRENW